MNMIKEKSKRQGIIPKNICAIIVSHAKYAKPWRTYIQPRPAFKG